MSLEVTSLLLDDLSSFHKNPRIGDVPAIAASLDKLGQYKPIVVNAGRLTGRPFEVLAGNHTLKAARSLGWASLDAVVVDVDEDTAARIVAADNRTADLGSYDDELLAELLAGIDDLEGTGYSDRDLAALLAAPHDGPALDRLVDRFGAAPLSVLSARSGDWQARKALWSRLGLASEDGRADNLLGLSPVVRFKNWTAVKQEAEARAGHALTHAEIERDNLDKLVEFPGAGTSVFDPALTELVYSWFSAPGMRIIDPWAGGSVRGIVAAVLGRDYVGVELRGEQIEANRKQLRVIDAAVRAGVAGSGGSVPEWVAGEGSALLEAMEDESFDLAFSAPPKYGPAADSIEIGDLTPVEEHGGVLVKRDDMFGVGSSRGGKVRSCLTLALAAREAGASVLVTAGSRQSPQVNIVAEVAAALGMRARVHVPTGPDTPEVDAAKAAGAEVVRHDYGRNSVIISRAHKDATEDPAAFEIPFGMETQAAVDLTAAQVANVPASVKRIVVPVGSGMTLAGILTGLAAAGRSVPVLGVVVGSDPKKRLDKYAPDGWREMVKLVPAGMDYHEAVKDHRLGDLVVDPIYEGKALRFLEPGDLLWVVGIRGTLAGDGLKLERLPEWVEGESTEELREMDAASYDLAFGCPPYYDLEKYSDDPRDLSNLSRAEFDAQMRLNIAEVARVLKPDSYAVWVVGSVRDKRGYILDMRRCMTEACEAAGLRLVNDAVLLTPIGSAAVRAAKSFKGMRSLTRVHQEVLVYVKGDRRRAVARVGEVAVGALADIIADEDGAEWK